MDALLFDESNCLVKVILTPDDSILYDDLFVSAEYTTILLMLCSFLLSILPYQLMLIGVDLQYLISTMMINVCRLIILIPFGCHMR